MLMQKQIEIPSWAAHVVSRIERRPNGITYSIYLEDDNWQNPDDDVVTHRSWLVWDKEILFGTSESRHAGCYAFQEAAKEQDKLAAEYTAILGGSATEQYATLDNYAPTPERRAAEIAHLEEKYAINAAVAKMHPAPTGKVLKYAVHVIDIATGKTVNRVLVDGGDIRNVRKVKKELDSNLDQTCFVTRIIAL